MGRETVDGIIQIVQCNSGVGIINNITISS